MFNYVQAKKVFDSRTVPKGSSEVSDEITVYLANGSFSLHVQVSGDGTCKFEYEVKNSNDANFIVPTGASEIATGVTKSSGENSDGEDHFPITPNTGIKLRIKATETGGSSSVTVTAWIAVQ